MRAVYGSVTVEQEEAIRRASLSNFHGNQSSLLFNYIVIPMQNAQMMQRSITLHLFHLLLTLYKILLLFAEWR